MKLKKKSILIPKEKIIRRKNKLLTHSKRKGDKKRQNNMSISSKS
jgi:hypothetical protein